MRGDEIEECGIGVEKPAQAEKHMFHRHGCHTPHTGLLGPRPRLQTFSVSKQHRTDLLVVSLRGKRALADLLNW